MTTAGTAGAVREVATEPWTGDPDAGPGAADPGPGPRSGADALDEPGDEILRLAAHLHAGTGRMLALLAEFDRREGRFI